MSDALKSQYPVFARIDRNVIRGHYKHLNLAAQSVYTVLMDFADPQGENAFPSQQTIAEILGVTRKTVNRAIRELKEAKLITVERRSQKSSLYTIVFPIPEAEVKSHDDSPKESS